MQFSASLPSGVPVKKWLLPLFLYLSLALGNSSISESFDKIWAAIFQIIRIAISDVCRF